MPLRQEMMQPAIAVIVGIIWLLIMIGVVVGYTFMLIAWWRAMKAHEKIAEKIGEIAEKLPQR